MSADTPAAKPHRELAWFIVSRRHEFMGEGHAAAIRAAAVAGYYAIHLASYLALAERTADDVRLHRGDTALAAAWVFLSLGVYVSLARRYFPPWLKYAVTAIDLVLLTALVSLHGGAASTLTVVFFPLIALAGLRLSVGLVRFATIGSMLGYLALVGAADPTWFSADHTIPVVTQFVVQLSLLLSGLAIGRIVRNIRLLAEEFVQGPRGGVS